MSKIFNVSDGAQEFLSLTPWKFNEFSKILYFLSQQKNSRIASKFMQTTYSGRATTVQSIAETTIQERPKDDADKTAPTVQGETPNMGVGRERRWIHSKLYEWGKLYCTPEEIQSIIDPHSPDLQAAKYTFARQYDDTAIAGFTADVQAGEYQTTKVIPFDVNQKGSGAFALETLISIWEKFGENEVDIDDPQNALTMILPQRELSVLMSDDKYQSILTNNTKVLTTGRPDTFMGFDFVHSERPGLKNGDEHKLYAFAKSGMMFAEQNGSRMTRMAERADRRFNVQAYECRSGGTVRLEEVKVFEFTATTAASKVKK